MSFYSDRRYKKDIRKTISTGVEDPTKGFGMKKSDFPVYENFIESLDKNYKDISENKIVPNRVTQTEIDVEVNKRIKKQEESNSKADIIRQNQQARREKAIDDQDALDNAEKQAQKEALRIKAEALETAAKVKKLDNEADDYFSRFNEPAELITPQQFNYDEKNYKKDLPFIGTPHNCVDDAAHQARYTTEAIRDLI